MRYTVRSNKLGIGQHQMLRYQKEPLWSTSYKQEV